MRTEDGYIIYKCLDGDSAAFGLLVDKYKAGVYALAYSRLRNFHDAEDVTQEVFIRVYRKLRTLRQSDSFIAWLHSITTNLCKDWIRNQSRRPDNQFIEDQNAQVLENPSLRFHKDKSIFETLHDAMDSLPKDYREVLTLYYLGVMDSLEIAKFLGMSPTTVRKQLSRSREQLREDMLNTVKTTFEHQKLKASFTFRIVEQVKNVRIEPISRINGLPYGISLSIGVIFTIMSFGQNTTSFKSIYEHSGSPLYSEVKILDVGEIPVDVQKITKNKGISIENNDSKGHELVFSVPKKTVSSDFYTENGKWISQANMPTARLFLKC